MILGKPPDIIGTYAVSRNQIGMMGWHLHGLKVDSRIMVTFEWGLTNIVGIFLGIQLG